ncbi:MAG: ergothioneine biosynthesis protein EgtB [Sphingomonadales bacterium]
MSSARRPSSTEAEARLARFRGVRTASERLAAPLSAEDCQVQSMPDVSPTKWHLAHSSWFFETFLLVPHLGGYARFDPAYEVLFNSYYVGVGDRYPRPARGLLSRPSLDEILAYRRHVDAAMERLIDGGPSAAAAELIELGLQHEQQHQELILMDIKHVLSCNPTDPVYSRSAEPRGAAPALAWIEQPGGLHQIGHDGDGFAFDNEAPRHRVWLDPFRIAGRLVTAGEYGAFIADGGYRTPELWLSDGWDTVVREGWEAPLYWRREVGGWTRFTLAGRRALDPDEPVLHVSYYEADAFARWAGRRLPTEAEWEVAATAEGGRPAQLFDAAWQWTASPYTAYPGFRPAAGAVGEYNGKFMVNQMTLRGASFATPEGHARATYRNFFPPHARWVFAGIRLAEDAR